MNRRSFLKWLGISPLLALLGKTIPWPKKKWRLVNYDYANKAGTCQGKIYSIGFNKTVFNPRDYGVISIIGR